MEKMFKRKYVMKPWKRKTSRFSPTSVKKKTYRRNARKNYKIRKSNVKLFKIVFILILLFVLYILFIN